MGNSFCCYNFEQKQQIVMQQELSYETFEESKNKIDKEKEKKIKSESDLEKNNSNKEQEKNEKNSIQINNKNDKSHDDNDNIKEPKLEIIFNISFENNIKIYSIKELSKKRIVIFLGIKTTKKKSNSDSYDNHDSSDSSNSSDSIEYNTSLKIYSLKTGKFITEIKLKDYKSLNGILVLKNDILAIYDNYKIYFLKPVNDNYELYQTINEFDQPINMWIKDEEATEGYRIN